MGFSISLFTLLTTTLFQTMVPKEMQGRFFGNIGLLTLGLQPVVMWLAGVAADSSSALVVFTGLDSFLLIFSLAWASLSRWSIGDSSQSEPIDACFASSLRKEEKP